MDHYKGTGHEAALESLTIMKEVVLQEIPDPEREFDDLFKTTLDFEREFRAAMARGKQRALAQRLNQTRDLQTRKRMTEAIGNLKQRVWDQMDDDNMDYQEEEARHARLEEARQARREARSRPRQRAMDAAREERLEREARQREDDAFDDTHKALIGLEELDEALNELEDLTFPDEPMNLPPEDPQEAASEADEIEDTSEEIIIEIPDEPTEEPQINDDPPEEDSTPGEEIEEQVDDVRKKIFEKLYDGQN